MKTNQIISIIICLILFSVEQREINENLHDITNPGYLYLFLAVTIQLYRNWLKNKNQDLQLLKAITILNGEMLGKYSNSHRLDYGEGVKGIDFRVDGQNEYAHITHVEAKNPVGQTIRVNENMNPNMRDNGRALGQKSRWQKNFWSNPERYSTLPNVNLEADFPESPQNILTLVDLYDVPSSDYPKFNEGFTSGSQSDPYVFQINK